MEKKNSLDDWVISQIADRSYREKLSPRVIRDTIDECADIAVELGNEQGLTKDEKLDIFNGCVVATSLNGKSIQDVKKDLRQTKKDLLSL
jgi:hypothetical protein